MNPKIQARYHVFGKNWASEPLRVTFFHPDFDKADLSDIKGVVTLKFRLFSNGRELDKEDIMIKKYSLGCCVCCYSDITKRDEYNKVNTVNMASLEYVKSLPNGTSQLKPPLDKNLHCVCIDNLLIDPIVFLYVCSWSNNVDDGFIEISDTDNFEIIKVDNPDLLYACSKIDPPKEVIEYSPSTFDFNRIERVKNRTKLIKIGEFIEEKRLSYFGKRDDGIIIEHAVFIPIELLNRYKNKIPKGVEEITQWRYSNLWSDDEENEKMLKRLKNGEVIKVRDINKEEIEELIDHYMKREKLTREKAIKRVRDNKFIADLPIFDEIDI